MTRTGTRRLLLTLGTAIAFLTSPGLHAQATSDEQGEIAKALIIVKGTFPADDLLESFRNVEHERPPGIDRNATLTDALRGVLHDRGDGSLVRTSDEPCPRGLEPQPGIDDPITLPKDLLTALTSSSDPTEIATLRIYLGLLLLDAAVGRYQKLEGLNEAQRCEAALELADYRKAYLSMIVDSLTGPGGGTATPSQLLLANPSLALRIGGASLGVLKSWVERLKQEVCDQLAAVNAGDPWTRLATPKLVSAIHETAPEGTTLVTPSGTTATYPAPPGHQVKERAVVTEGSGARELIVISEDSQGRWITRYEDADGDGLPELVPVGGPTRLFAVGAISSGAEFRAHRSRDRILVHDRSDGYLWVIHESTSIGSTLTATIENPLLGAADFGEYGGALSTANGERLVFLDSPQLGLPGGASASWVDLVAGSQPLLVSNPNQTVAQARAPFNAPRLLGLEAGATVLRLGGNPGEAVSVEEIGNASSTPVLTQTIGMNGFASASSTVPALGDLALFRVGNSQRSSLRAIISEGAVADAVDHDESGDGIPDRLLLSASPARLHLFEGLGDGSYLRRYELVLEGETPLAFANWSAPIPQFETLHAPRDVERIPTLQGLSHFVETRHDLDGDGTLAEGITIVRDAAADHFVLTLLQGLPGSAAPLFSVALDAGFEPGGFRVFDDDADGDLDVLIRRDGGGSGLRLRNDGGAFVLERHPRLSSNGATFGRPLLAQDLMLDSSTGNDAHLGVAILGAELFVSGRAPSATGSHEVYRLDAAGNLLGQFPQDPGVASSAWGYRDGASDRIVSPDGTLRHPGSVLFFGSETGLYVVDPATGALASHYESAEGTQLLATNPITGPALSQLAVFRAVAYDPFGDRGRGSFFLADFDSPLLEIDAQGSVLRSHPNEGWSLYGLARDPMSGMLWGNGLSGGGVLVEIDPDSGRRSGATLPWKELEIPGGLDFAHTGVFGDDRVDLVALAQSASSDRIAAFRLHRHPGIRAHEEARLVVRPDGLSHEPPLPWCSGQDLVFGYDVGGDPSLGNQPALLLLAFDLLPGINDAGDGFTLGGSLDELLIRNALSTPRAQLPVVLGDGFGTGSLLGEPLHLLPPTLGGGRVTLPIPPEIGSLPGEVLRAQTLHFHPDAVGGFVATNDVVLRSLGSAPAGILVEAIGANSFNDDDRSAFFRIHQLGVPGSLPIDSLTIDLSPLGGSGFDVDQSGMAGLFLAGNGTLAGCTGSYRLGSDVACGLVYDALQTYGPAGLPVPCDPTAGCGFIASNPTSAAGHSYSRLQFRFAGGSFFARSFLFDADTDVSTGVSGGDHAGALITISSGGVSFSGTLQLDPSNPQRAFVVF